MELNFHYDSNSLKILLTSDIMGIANFAFKIYHCNQKVIQKKNLSWV